MINVSKEHRDEVTHELALTMMRAYDKYHDMSTAQKYIDDIKATCFYPQAEAVIELLEQWIEKPLP